jgi:hypothetical protein
MFSNRDTVGPHDPTLSVTGAFGDFAMVDVETKIKRETPADAPTAVWTPEPAPHEAPRRRLRVLPFVITAAVLAVAGADLGNVGGLYGSAADA